MARFIAVLIAALFFVLGPAALIAQQLSGGGGGAVVCTSSSRSHQWNNSGVLGCSGLEERFGGGSTVHNSGGDAFKIEGQLYAASGGNAGDGTILIQKITTSAAAPGAANARLEVVCGTNAGTAKIIAYGGTSTTPATVLDNIGSGVSGC